MNEQNSIPVKREHIEWCRIWVPDSATADLSVPRVLLIGDSIVMGYAEDVEKQLAGRASVARMGSSRYAADPAFLDEIAMVLRYTTFDIIHFNNGLHGFENSDESYEEFLPIALAAVRRGAPLAKLAIATCTPKRSAENVNEWHPRSPRVEIRNGMIRDLAARENLPLTDLFEVARDHPEYYSPDGTHFNAEGNVVLGAAVAAAIQSLL